MNQKELTKTFMLISNWKKTFGVQGFHKNNFSALRVKNRKVNVDCCDINGCPLQTALYTVYQVYYPINTIRSVIICLFSEFLRTIRIILEFWQQNFMIVWINFPTARLGFSRSQPSKPPAHFIIGKRHNQLFQTQIKLNLSSFNFHFYQRHCINSPHCPCGDTLGTPHHHHGDHLISMSIVFHPSTQSSCF